VFALGASRAAFALSGLAVNVAMARWLPREAFGVYRWLMSVSAIAAFGGHLGLGSLVTRELVRAPGGARAWVGAALRTTSLLSTTTAVAVVAYVAVRDPRPDVVWAGVWTAVGLGVQALSQVVEAALHGLHETRREVAPTLVGRGLLVVGNLALLALGYGVTEVMAGRLAAALVTLGMLLLALRDACPPADGDAPPTVGALLNEGRTFGATVLFGAIYAQADVLMLEAMAGDAEVARYGAPASVLLQLALIGAVLTRSYFPRLAALGDDPSAARAMLAAQSHALLMVALPVAGGGAVLARELVPALFGPGYADAAMPFLLLALAVPLRFLHGGYGLALSALDGQAARMRIDRAAAALNVGANLVAIPLGGAVGAACTTLLTDLYLVARLEGAHRRRLGGVDHPATAGRLLAATSGMMACVALSAGWPVGWRVLVGVVTYPAWAWALGAVDRGHLRQLRRL
jgi:O-antigen/teichoic acid export membrane protein